MNQNIILQDLQSLPPEAQQQVVDFIAFLQTRYGGTQKKRKSQVSTDLSKEAFVGIWLNRAEMQDSSAWVRRIRTDQWK